MKCEREICCILQDRGRNVWMALPTLIFLPTKMHWFMVNHWNCFKEFCFDDTKKIISFRCWSSHCFQFSVWMMAVWDFSLTRLTTDSVVQLNQDPMSSSWHLSGASWQNSWVIHKFVNSQTVCSTARTETKAVHDWRVTEESVPCNSQNNLALRWHIDESNSSACVLPAHPKALSAAVTMFSNSNLCSACVELSLINSLPFHWTTPCVIHTDKEGISSRSKFVGSHTEQQRVTDS